ncbi:uncharacterized protein BX663DRAFT_528421 [Cokeromyces recurvatus]|uniref:uncharacterized protein n=1 Tax=Cokeromyces recurvatus TaxID=90255 RepID=UPI0022207B68|nr:uncharacterized protein BX663DRAFT_528421 [Cokeromyces recurvatus]KAI7907664.1 hypothetical protein BX663DRAFT_528421 [Cokeromyces recurvatus]
MTTEGYSTKAIQAAVRKEIFTPCTQSISEIETLFSMYPTDYRFHKDSIFYNVVARPVKHFKAFYRLAQLVESEKLKEFICFPIRTTFIPAYMTVDMADFFFKKKAFKEQGLNKSLHFEGTLETNGIELASTNGRCVLIDPGRRDILYCMKETSVVKHKEVLVFTKNDRSKRSRHFRTLRKSTKPSMVESAEALLSKTPLTTVDVVKFVDYIKTRSSMENILNQYYGNKTKSSEVLYFPGSLFSFRVDEKSNLDFGHLFVLNIRGVVSSPDTRTQSQLYHMYLQLMLQQRHISERLDDGVKNTVLELAEKMIADEEVNLKQHISELLEKLQVLLFRKLKFSSRIFYDQNDQMLVKRLKKKFGHDAILVIGIWSASNTKYHEPTRSIGLTRMLKKNGFQIFKTDEYKTSSCCPTCESSLETFKTVANPCLHKRAAKMPTVKCHGLLR